MEKKFTQINEVSRRGFLKTTAAASAAVTLTGGMVVPSVFAAGSDKI